MCNPYQRARRRRHSWRRLFVEENGRSLKPWPGLPGNASGWTLPPSPLAGSLEATEDSRICRKTTAETTNRFDFSSFFVMILCNAKQKLGVRDSASATAGQEPQHQQRTCLQCSARIQCTARAWCSAHFILCHNMNQRGRNQKRAHK